jgi:hypothetical protein
MKQSWNLVSDCFVVLLCNDEYGFFRDCFVVPPRNDGVRRDCFVVLLCCDGTMFGFPSLRGTKQSILCTEIASSFLLAMTMCVTIALSFLLRCDGVRRNCVVVLLCCDGTVLGFPSLRGTKQSILCTEIASSFLLAMTMRVEIALSFLLCSDEYGFLAMTGCVAMTNTVSLQ